jgi:hypothetical protein
MSDSFLKLWKKHRSGTASSTEEIIIRYIRPLQVELAVVKEQVESLQEQKSNSVKRSVTPPQKKEIMALSLGKLRQLAKEWNFALPKKTSIQTARRLLLARFGHSTLE